MLLLAFPLALTFLKPQRPHLSFVSAGKRHQFHNAFRCHGSFIRTSTARAAAICTGNIPQQVMDSRRTCVHTFQQAVQRLQEYWASVGCAVMQCSNTEVGAGTMNPLTFLRVLGPEPWNVAYLEPSIRPDDSRYGENPNRLQRHTQFQVILKPDPGNSQDLFIRSLLALGIDVEEHDIRFVEDNWESPVLGAWGLGWEVWMDGMEITQFTYFQQAGSLQLSPISVEITYGLERILMLLQEVDHFKNIQYADGITYGELFLENEKEMSAYYLEHATVDRIQQHFEFFEEEARSLLSLGLAIPAYDQLLKTSHAFNILDARGFVGVTERARYFGRMRSLARQCAQLWVKTRESLAYPFNLLSSPVALIVDTSQVVVAVLWDSRMFVLEIGTEEMPPNDVVDACQQLKALLVEFLGKQRLGHGEVLAWGTPRRLVVLVDNLNAKQAESVIEVRGPPVTKAFDHLGNITKAGDGFCRRYGLPLDALYKKADGKTEYVFLEVKESIGFALEVLADNLPGMVGKISFPKSMRWCSQLTFSRPIRWILALHGDVVVPFTIAEVSSGNLSYGLRNTPSAIIEVEDAERYISTMKKAGIDICFEERRKTIVKDAYSLAKAVGGHLVINNILLDEVVNLVEAPIPILGKFKESFLQLPEDLLTMVMQKHQKYFSIKDENGKLLPCFIAVANGPVNEAVVRKGNEAVLRARYEDAKFFYEIDTSKRFSEFRSRLRGILFHEKLGTMLDKMIRVERIVPKISFILGVDTNMLVVIQDAASLAMSDLATAVVTEFTSLAGSMARHYALKDGYSEQIAQALFEITLPRFSGDILPKTEAGIALAIADRLDSLIGLFGAGCQPSSSSDPFGLRRIAYGLVQVLVEREKNLDLKKALALAAEVQPIEVNSSTSNDVQQFITRRLEQYLVDKGISSEIVNSSLLERANFPCLAAKTAVRMEALLRGELLPKIVQAYSRPTRIIRGKDLIIRNFLVNEAVFESNEERDLWSAFCAVKTKVHPGIEVDDFVETSLQLLQPLENFFDNVFVMVEDERVRKNRLTLLKNIADLPRGIVDLSVLPGF
ncbi:hypothetical protein Sjap_020146 [Stephania japonica]|uniref:glycine--tRNA ligase n=1 Tax=Stephania japonica TaxID=461633 RepID=A0AAP0F2Y0_9MAGN